MKKHYYTRAENFDTAVFAKAFEFLLDKSNSKEDKTESILIITLIPSTIVKLKKLFKPLLVKHRKQNPNSKTNFLVTTFDELAKSDKYAEVNKSILLIAADKDRMSTCETLGPIETIFAVRKYENSLEEWIKANDVQDPLA